MQPAISYSESSRLPLDEGLRQVERMFRAIIYPPAEPILITDDERYCLDASCGTGKLLGLARDQIIGRRIDEFMDLVSRTQIDENWNTFLQKGELRRDLRFFSAEGAVHDMECSANANILPGRHALALRHKTSPNQGNEPASAHDFAVYLFGTDGRVISWFEGATRVYGYSSNEIINLPVSRLSAGKDFQLAKQDEELKRAAAQGHCGIERRHTRKDGTRFWANVLTIALRSQEGELQCFARIVRDFSQRHSEEENLLLGGAVSITGRLTESSIAGVVSGEFDQILEANDAFLQMVGYSREDLAGGQLSWPSLTSTQYLRLDELALEEALRYGASTPFEKELIRKDGTAVGVLVTFAVLNLAPFHWIACVHVPANVGEGERVGDEPRGRRNFEKIVGQSAEMKRVFELVETVAPTDATVLILGETGTGKELIARSLHQLSHRSHSPFVTLNCAAIPTGLLESELFGHEKGAFTGALAQKIGRFEMANHGTLFLDEVGDIPIDLQPKLLRALQERAFERLGGTKTIPIDVRLIAATNRDLTQMMADKLFRSDLYYRLKVFPITTPPLRHRPEDIPALAEYFIRKYSDEMGRHIEHIPKAILRALAGWSWPGNVRELENFIQRSVILSMGTTLHAPLNELCAEVVHTPGTLKDMERDYIIRTLREANGVVSGAAARLGIPRTTLNAMIRKLGISRKDI